MNPSDPTSQDVLVPPILAAEAALGGTSTPPDRGSDRGARRRGVRSAAALRYRRREQRAPTVTAAGRGEVAERIIALALQHGIYIQSDPDLVEILCQLDLGAAIPPQLYYVVAEILAFVYNLNSGQETGSSAVPGRPEDNQGGTTAQ